MKKSTILFLFLNLYSLVWRLALPILRKNARLREGIKERTSSDHFDRADIWIQGASAGECNLAVQIAKRLSNASAVKNRAFASTISPTSDHSKPILLTSTTSQGVGLLSQNLSAITSIKITWFPFDIPGLMERVVCKVKPSLIVLLETELWPSLIFAAKKHGVKVIVINGRMSKKSHKNYLKTRWLWSELQPDTVLATTQIDAQRFKDIFPCSTVDVMPNMKFDSILSDSLRSNIPPTSTSRLTSTPFSKIFTTSSKTLILPTDIPFSIFASVRKEEEEEVIAILDQILEKFPNQLVGLFPRHMHRVQFWKKALTDKNHKWILRSEIKSWYTDKTENCTNPMDNLTETLSPATVILWDIFGDLKNAYAIATVAFVGGSLKPLGGHNFIEPLISGVATVTGPFTDDFAWVGEEIFISNIVKKANNRDQVTDFIVSSLNNPLDRGDIITKCLNYIENKNGGTQIAFNIITNYL